MLEIDALVARVGAFRLGEVNLTVKRGEFHVVLGPSGSGKSTLLNAVLGVLPPVSGHLRLEGRELAGVPVERRGLGYVPQQLGLFPHLTVRANLAYSARARRVPAAEFQPLLEAWIETTGIGDLLERMPGTLSGGERQRVGLVRALASQPRLVLLDEPFNALNESLRRELWGWLRKLQRERELAVLMITHDLAEAHALADRVTVLLGGRVAQQGERAEVYDRPATEEVARFLGIETLQVGRVVAISEGRAMVEVGAARIEAAVPPGFSAREALVCIRGENVILTGEEIAGDNPRQVLPARVLSVMDGSPLMRVELDAGFRLTALVMRTLCEELKLHPGRKVTALIRACEVHLIPVTESCSGIASARVAFSSRRFD